jgi:hypothetical protein
MFAKYRLTHVPVMEMSETGEQRLRGLLSAAKVKRLLSRSESVRRTGDDHRDQLAGGMLDLKRA